MFLSLMLVGYATSKMPNAKGSAAAWVSSLFSTQPEAAPPAACAPDTQWDLGAEAWVTLPAQSSTETRADCWR